MGNDIMMALQAAQSGEQDVFDSMLIGILGKGQNSSERIKETIPILNKAAHQVGAELFSLWWNPDQYKEDFTTDEIYELEQSLLDLFKGLGDTALLLSVKKKIYGEQ